MSPSAGLSWGGMLLCTFQRPGCNEHEGSRGAVLAAATDGCVAQVGRRNLTTASSGSPRDPSGGRGQKRDGNEAECFFPLQN